MKFPEEFPNHGVLPMGELLLLANEDEGARNIRLMRQHRSYIDRLIR